jgi:hypothetical protein
MELRYGDAVRGRAEVSALAESDKLPLAARHKALDALADDDLLAGRVDRAVTAYQTLAAETPDEDAARTLEVKALAARDAEARPAVTALLVSAPGRRPPDPALAALLLGEWHGKSQSPLADYLIGKMLASHAYWVEAAARFEATQGADLPPRVAREAVRQRAIAACALGDVGAVEQVRALAEDPKGVYAGSAGGRQDGVLRLLHRCVPASR